MRTCHSIVVAALIGLVPAGGAHAQITQPPERPFRGLFGTGGPVDPNRSRQELTLTSTFTTGFEDALGNGAQPGLSTQETAESRVGQVDSTLRYWAGTTAKNIEARGRGFVLSYPSLNTGTMIGGAAHVQGALPVGRRISINASQSANYQPLLSLGTFGSVTADIGGIVLPDIHEALALREQRSWTYDSSAAVLYRLAARHSVSANGLYSKREYVEDDGFNNSTINGGLSYAWTTSRTTAVQTSYRYNTTTVGGDISEPQTDQSVEVGLSYTRRLGPTRTMRLEGGMGAAYVDTLDQFSRERATYWTPAGHGQMRVDVGRSWAAWADYRRSLNVLDAVARQAFWADAVILRVGGYLNRRTDLTFAGGLSKGRTGGGLADIGRYSSYTGTVQGRYALLRNLAMLVSYDYYTYDVRGLVTRPDFPTSAERDTIRIGLTLWVPLYGRYGAAPLGGGGQ